MASRFHLFNLENRNSKQNCSLIFHPLASQVIASILESELQIETTAELEKMGTNTTDWFNERFAGFKNAEREAIDELEFEEDNIGWWLPHVSERQYHETEQAASMYVIRRGTPAWLNWLERLAESQTDKELSDTYWTLSNLYERLGMTNKCLDTAKSMAALDKTQDRPREAALAKGKIADVLQSQGEVEEALRIRREEQLPVYERLGDCLLYTSPSPRDKRQSRMPSSA